MSRAVVIVASLGLALGGCNARITLGSRSEPSDADAAFHFPTLPPQSNLPSGADCSAMVARAGFEPRPENTPFNRTTPSEAELAAFHAQSWVAVDDRARSVIRPRIDGAFTGTTDEIIAWAACKWGFEDDMLRAAAVPLSDWRQSAEGGAADGGCPPDVAPAADGTCPHLFGIFAVNYDAEDSAHSTWPELRASTAFNADFMGGFLRMCFEGYVTWLDSPEVTPMNGGQYVPGDAWNCLGFAVAGRWKNDDALAFTRTARAAFDARPWLAKEF